MKGYVDLAKIAIKEFAQSGRTLEVPPDVLGEMKEKRAGVFVTIHKGKELRGCIGTFVPTKKDVAEEIVANAISACSRDPRFFPVEETELDELEIEVSILGEAKPMGQIQKHDPQKEGIIVAAEDGRKGLLLPGLEGIDTTQQQIKTAAEKGGIDPEAEPIQLLSFETKIYKS